MLYVDDRSWAAPAARQCAQIGRQWREWSAILGLKENETKDQYHHRTVRGRRQLLAVGVEGDKITPWPKILGITLVPAVGRKTRGTESDRLHAAAWVLIACPFLLPLVSGLLVLVASARLFLDGCVVCPPCVRSVLLIGRLPCHVGLHVKLILLSVVSCLVIMLRSASALRVIKLWLFGDV